MHIYYHQKLSEKKRKLKKWINSQFSNRRDSRNFHSQSFSIVEHQVRDEG